MIIAYCQAAGILGNWSSSVSTIFSGHTSLAFTQVVENGAEGVWVSYSTSDKQVPGYKKHVMGKFAIGHFGIASYRVQLPTQEDGVDSQLQEQAAYNWFVKKDRNYKDCVDCTNRILEKAGAFHYYSKWIMPTTPGQFVGWAGDIQKSMIKSMTGWPAEPVNPRLFKHDNLKGKTVIPWGYGGGIGNNESGRQRLAAMTTSRLQAAQVQRQGSGKLSSQGLSVSSD